MLHFLSPFLVMAYFPDNMDGVQEAGWQTFNPVPFLEPGTWSDFDGVFQLWSPG